MAGLPSDLHMRCHTTLIRCGEFDTHASLQAIFVTEELRPYRDRLPQATSNKADRVNQTMLFLLEQNLSGGRPVFPIFLATLYNKYMLGDALRDELEGLYAEVEQAISHAMITVPFVIAAMNHDQATDLFTETVFDDPAVAQIERERFRQFMAALHAHGLEALVPHYGVRPENWQPYTCEGAAIGKIISDMIDHINLVRREMPGMQLICPRFSSGDFFEEDRVKRLQSWEQLKQSGGVLIVDAVSLFHPGLRQKLAQSETASNERIAMLVLSPVNSRANQVDQLIEEVIDSQMALAFSRFDEHLDRLCEIGVGDLRAIQRWLYTILPEEASILQDQKPNPQNRRMIRDRMKREPLGIERIIYGQRGGQ